MWSTICSSPGGVKPKTSKLVFAVSPQETQIQHYEVRVKTGLLEIRMICLSGVIRLQIDVVLAN